MSLNSILRAGAASCVLAAVLGFGATASAQSYYDRPSYESSRHHSDRYHTIRYEKSRHQHESASGPMHSEQGMQSAAYTPMPPAFQVPLDRIPDAKQALKSATVRDEDGNSIGSVRDVETAPDGQPDAIRISVGGVWGVNTKTVAVDAREFRYERARNELTADLSKGQIESLPSVKP